MGRSIFSPGGCTGATKQDGAAVRKHAGKHARGRGNCVGSEGYLMDEMLPWATLLGGRCQAVREPRTGDDFHGRCELVPDHRGIDHALDRGVDTPRWSTDWTS